MKQENKKRGLLAGIGAFVTATALALSGALAANADALEVPEEANVIITKLSQGEIGDAATGIEAGQPGGPSIPAGSEPIAGVEFKYTLVEDTGVGETYDIGTNAGQQHAAGLDVSTAQLSSVTGTFASTDNDGETAKVLDRGLYLIEEVVTPTGVISAPPFLLAVPLTDPQNLNSWLTEIYVYPKNTKIEATKSVAEGDSFVTGEDVTWTIKSDVPRYTDGDEYVKPESFQITDTLDERLSLTGTPSVKILNADPAEILLTEGENEDYKLDVNGQEITITFKHDGLIKLENAATFNEAVVEVTFVTEVESATVPEGKDNAIINNANIIANANEPDEINITTNDAKTYWGEIAFEKVDEENTGLAGAKFALFSSLADAENLEHEILGSVTSSDATGSEGEVVFNGVLASDRVNGELQDETDWKVYWIRETEAPSGYQLLAEPIPVVLKSDGKIYKVTFNAENEIEVGSELTAIENVPTAGGFVLPLTGGMGTAFLTVIGIGILVFVLVAARRRRSADA